jgi:hypothetical protein
MKWRRRESNPRNVPDPLGDRPEDFFVVAGRLGEVHAGIVPRSVPDTK